MQLIHLLPRSSSIYIFCFVLFISYEISNVLVVFEFVTGHCFAFI